MPMSTPTPTAPAPPPPAKPARFMKWHRRVLGLCFVLFAFELGIILLAVPWRESWSMSWIPLHSPRLSVVWMSPYFRGALSGLGLLNIYVACLELVNQLRSIFGR